MEVSKTYMNKNNKSLKRKKKSILVASYTPKLEKRIKQMKNSLNRGVSIGLKGNMWKG